MVRSDSLRGNSGQAPQVNQNNIRNFAIVAHVDHGKSTLADRLLEITGTVSREKIREREQFLDQSPIAREHGITIKLAPVRMEYRIQNENKSIMNSELYILNLIDTPGHVDFSYEVTRTLYACEGVVLLVDATRGIQAQTVAHFNFAKKLGLTIVPVINKIDLPTADVSRVKKDIVESFEFRENEVLQISAKTGEGTEQLIQEIIRRIPPPKGNIENPLQALIFDSVYNEHKGVVIYVRLKNGKAGQGDMILFLSDKGRVQVLEVGYMRPLFHSTDKLSSGEVGYIITNIKDVSYTRVGDTITTVANPSEPLPGYSKIKPYVFLALFPASADEFENLKRALLKLKLTDASLSFSPEHSNLLGPGFRCGFLGLLHAQIIIERIEKEFGIDIFSAPPNIEYLIDGRKVSNPRDFPPTGGSKRDIQEPYILGEIYTPQEYLGSLFELIYIKRGKEKEVVYFGSQVKIVFEMPLSEVVYDFYDKVKSVSSGFASFDYEFLDYRQSDLVKVDIVLNNKVVDELSLIVHKGKANVLARSIVEKLKNTIPKHQFVVTIQAKIGGKVIAGEKIQALRKDVTEKLYGGDYTRKAKLLDKQKTGKKKMRTIGNVSVPKEIFTEVLKSQ